jgi:hypothetical protein
LGTVYEIWPHILVYLSTYYKFTTMKTPSTIVFGGVVVIKLATRFKVCEFKLSQERWIFKGVKICNMTSFRGEVKTSPHVVRFYGMSKIPVKYDRATSSAKFTDIS